MPRFKIGERVTLKGRLREVHSGEAIGTVVSIAPDSHGKTPRKAAQERKTLIIKIRVNVGQLKMLQAAAGRASLDLSTWIRTVALRAAKEE